jgi:hypothetical protein
MITNGGEAVSFSDPIHVHEFSASIRRGVGSGGQLVVKNEVMSPDELLKGLKRYLEKSRRDTAVALTVLGIQYENVGDYGKLGLPEHRNSPMAWTAW